jgi:capsule biosynthesis phosphatase
MTTKNEHKEYLKKRVIVDFDDTLCIYNETSSGVCDGEPNNKLILKLRELHRAGFNIEIYTARGHFSAKNRNEASRKYKNIIENWLKEHNVPYTNLSFNKPYGIIYIDDKAVRPDELSRLDSLMKE